MILAELRKAIDDPWRRFEPIPVGGVPAGLGSPDAYVTIERDGQPFARIDVWQSRSGPFEHVSVWGRFVVLGLGDRVHLVDPITRDATSFVCDGYFGRVYPVGDALLIADSARLSCLDAHGAKVWESDPLGIDGVVVEDVRDSVVVGSGEWDPPGGWRPFMLSLSTGKPTTR